MILSRPEIREVLAQEFGAGNCRIKHDGTINVYGKMPSSAQTGWYLFGYMDDPQTVARIEWLYTRLCA